MVYCIQLKFLVNSGKIRLLYRNTQKISAQKISFKRGFDRTAFLRLKNTKLIFQSNAAEQDWRRLIFVPLQINFCYFMDQLIVFQPDKKGSLRQFNHSYSNWYIETYFHYICISFSFIFEIPRFSFPMLSTPRTFSSTELSEK